MFAAALLAWVCAEVEVELPVVLVDAVVVAADTAETVDDTL
jgi:hypothetical protein